MANHTEKTAPAADQPRIYNRDSFLDNIAKQLGRERRTTPVERPALKYRCHHDVMADKSQDELKDVLIEYTQTALGSQAITTTQAELAQTLKSVCLDYCRTEASEAGDAAQYAGETILSADPRLLALVNPAVLAEDGHQIHIWDQAAGYEPNIAVAERAKVGVVFAEQALAESGTMVLYSNPKQGRAVSLLPEASVFVVPKSTLVARLTQATAALHEKARNGERMPSCVNFISGPSSTADIELIKVVGVHGPVYATYIIIDDM
ncbi:LutC/YkgG family protein [Photobacterium atrarenae]|uniref:Lactate utilization protein C n=1 Tax=Photobacterium atrarenae TaxID=865757 RepID=A0ABY5GJL9_9GAMM|nr:lactate utilization protein C [Photobacterium atrarenae]UTV28767.1 lactate utilization protein C [Photobacterium atrarenae]